MENTFFVITRGINEYDQDGEYFHAVFITKPTREELRLLFYGKKHARIIGPSNEEKFITHLLNGGGRQEYENEWYYLTEIKSGELYKHYSK